jgi:hypothetical protein
VSLGDNIRACHNCGTKKYQLPILDEAPEGDKVIGKMELALYEEDGVLFFLYQIDGIFKEGWGDAPLGLALLKPEEWPTEEILKDKTLHLYLVDSNLSVLLSLRQVQLGDGFHQIIRNYIEGQQAARISPKEYTEKVHRIWQGLTSAAMREKAVAVQKVPLALGH